MTFRKRSFPTFLILLCLGLFFTACNKDDITPSTETTNAPTNSSAITLLSNANNNTSNSGNGEEVDCFEVQYPINVLFPDGTTQTVNSDDELFAIEDAWDEMHDEGTEGEDTEGSEMDYPTLEFPITVTLEDGTSQSIQDEDTLEDILEDCYGDYDDWDDDEDDGDDDDDDYDDEYGDDDCPDFDEFCFDLVYPVGIVFPDGTTITVNSDDELFDAEDNWYETQGEETDDPTLAFPVTVILEDGTQQTINNEEELIALFETCEMYDDDYDDFEECFEFVFPVSVIQNGTTVTVNNEMEAYDLLDDVDFDDIEIVFPITVELEDGTQQAVNSEDELYDLCE